ncbi:hypothetical protein ACFQI7_34715 [Paenibacillus allorhizosphaerae]|uniref:Copper resistance protein D domain-containing protein n=1 Tax=Paenibacillus allorhizosphaerae TaxID=2849866 RepID=A0ABN7TV67_9BACL|nr:hypothetical protein [Paenibacillus allorhizosphaerae]CAG7657051.1 hypothetical protein PAECIP111802_06598 [Paenibacillus allorhizosphaerae]
MFGFMLFLHLTGLFVWLGSLLATIVVLAVMKQQIGSQPSNALAARIIKVFSRFAHPGAFIVLVSGVVMIVQMGMGPGKPLWLEVMEKGGGTIILLALIVTGIWGSKVKKQLNAGQEQAVKFTGYLATMSSFMVAIVLVVLAVSMKI